MELYAIETGNLKLDGGAMFGVVPKSLWNKIYPADENNLCNLCMRALLIVKEDRKILIDCGMGDTMDSSLEKFYFLNGDDSLQKSLAEINISFEAITDVVFTHMHFDHCGGATRFNASKTGYEVSFPNAHFWSSKAQWDSIIKPNRREKPSFLKENIEPIEQSGMLSLIETDTELIEGIELKLFHGHTAGQIIPHIKYKNHTLVYVADMIPTAAHIPSSFVCGYDILPLLSIDEKDTFLANAVSQNYTLFFEHDIQLQCCSLQNTPKGVRMKEAYSLKDFMKMAE
ncbi:MAG: MBL fold metallo-hydrolase [Bacteroidales bacterium]|nr:MBL fold metallo-hydrolase [Bacteroidales bacterium]